MGRTPVHDVHVGRFIDEGVVREAAEVVRIADDDPGMTMSIRFGDGREVRLPESLGDFLMRMVADVSRGHDVRVRSMPEDLTTSVAAAELGCSRPTLMKLIHRGEIPAHKVGTHTRVRRADVVAYAARKEERIRAAAAALLAVAGSDDD